MGFPEKEHDRGMNTGTRCLHNQNWGMMSEFRYETYQTNYLTSTVPWFTNKP